MELVLHLCSSLVDKTIFFLRGGIYTEWDYLYAYIQPQ